ARPLGAIGVAAHSRRKGRSLPVQPQQRTKVFETLFENYEGPAFSMRLWDGWQWFSPQCGEPACTIVFSSEGALAEAFLSKEIDVEGDIFSVFDVAEHIFQCPRGQRQRVVDVIGAAFAGVGYSLRHGRTHSVERDHEAITYHYDQPPEFYRPWLGTTMAYSCGYFDTPSDDVDTAQVSKLELICRKLRLQPGERFLDIGCGWGGLILHAAAEHGANAQGTTISKQQAAVAARRIADAHLAQCCHATLLDYRKAPQQFGQFDK